MGQRRPILANYSAWRRPLPGLRQPVERRGGGEVSSDQPVGGHEGRNHQRKDDAQSRALDGPERHQANQLNEREFVNRGGWYVASIVGVGIKSGVSKPEEETFPELITAQ